MSDDHDAFRRQMGQHMATAAPQAAALGFRFVSAGEGRGSIEVPWRGR